MTRFITPIILIAIAASVFFIFTNPLYSGSDGISALNAQIASYNEALNNSKSFDSERDKLTEKYNNFNPDDLARLKKLLPDNVDNIRLILEIEQIAAPYGMTLADVKYDATPIPATAATTATPEIVQAGGSLASPTPKDYGIFNLTFSTSGSYDNFINLTKDLESNLRVVDISSITFTSDTGTAVSSVKKINPAETYKYDFKIKTYWLKN
jgi:hypothetical protein